MNSEEALEIETLRVAALKAVLERITKSVTNANGTDGRAALRLAETYAWLTSPGQAHGGAAATDSK